MSEHFDTWLVEVSRIAREAGARIMAIYTRDDLGIEAKADESPLTLADKAAHEHIVAELAALTPDIPVLSEESTAIPFSVRQSWGRYWLVDPLDGTKEFIKRNGEFTVNIALIDQHQPVFGVVYAPALDELYTGAQGLGASKTGSHSGTRPIKVQDKANASPRVVASRSHRGELLDKYLHRLGDHEVVSMGSSLKICLVAEGRADLYPRLGPTCEWDTAAAHAVVLAAGGQLTDTELKPLQYNRKDEYLNPHFLVFGEPRDWSQYLRD